MKKDLASILADLRREYARRWPGQHAHPWPELGTVRKGMVRREEHIEYFDYPPPGAEYQPGIGYQKWLAYWDNVDQLLPELVSLAAIRPEAYKGFCLAVHERLLDVLVHNDRRIHSLCDDTMLEAERRLRSAQDAIGALSEIQRMRIGLELYMNYEGDFPEPEPSDPESTGWATEWTCHIPKVLDIIARITRSAPYRSSEPKKRGPKRERSNLVLREFIRDLWRIAQAHGGDFTLWADDRGGAKGTIAEALHLLKPVLPPRLVPNVIPRTTLNRLRPDHNCAK